MMIHPVLRLTLKQAHSLAAVIKEHYGKKILYGMVLLVVIANTINIGADIGVMAATAHLIILIALIASNQKIMGKYKSRALSNIFVWLTFLGMTGTVVAMIVVFL